MTEDTRAFRCAPACLDPRPRRLSARPVDGRVHVTWEPLALECSSELEVIVEDSSGEVIERRPLLATTAEVDFDCGSLSASSGRVRLRSTDTFEAVREVVVGYSCDTGSGRWLPFDCNGDGEVDISDSVCHLGYLFLGQGSPLCLPALDYNGDGAGDISDPTAALNYLFQGGPPPFFGTACRSFDGCPPSDECR